MESNELHRAEFEADQEMKAPTRPCARCGKPLVLIMHVYCCGWPVDCRARAHVSRPIQAARFLNDAAYRRVIETYPNESRRA